MTNIDRMLKIAADNYLHYAADPSRRGIDEYGACLYLTKDGNKCGVGRYMIEPTTDLSGVIADVAMDRQEENPRYKRTIDPLLKRQYRGLSIEFWSAIQKFHDDEDVWYGPDRKENIPTKNPIQQDLVYAAYLVLDKDIARGKYV